MPGNLLNILLWIFRIINFALKLVIILFLASFIVQFIPGAMRYTIIQKIYSYTMPSISYVSSMIPTQFFRYEFGALIIIGLILIVKAYIYKVISFLDDKAYRYKRRYNARQFAVQTLPPASDEPKGRTSLLKQWIDIKEKLEKSQRLLAFLAVDVIGSTLMKEGEDPHVVEYTFSEYKKFIEEILSANNVWKVTWTPDGLMSAFLTMEEAVTAGKEIIIGLDAFNKYVNQLKTPLRVRCGINHGKVVFDMDARMEEVTHRVIDIAGHLQKSAEPDTIWISKQIFDYLATKEKTVGFRQIKIKVDNTDVVEWKKS